MGIDLEENKLDYWWELSYAGWLTLPRSLIQEMPIEWQNKLCELLKEFDEEFPNKLEVGTRVLFTKNGKLTLGPKWLNNYRRPNYEEINKMRGWVK